MPWVRERKRAARGEHAEQELLNKKITQVSFLKDDWLSSNIEMD